MIFGCAVGLRFSDLKGLTQNHIEQIGTSLYLVKVSQKTKTMTRVKLPPICVSIIEYYKTTDSLLPFPSKNQFNNNLKKLGEVANWTEFVGKYRELDGVRREIFKKNGTSYRFCDLLSSHIMRKTAITTLLLSGMPEHLVRKISGHAPNSSEFFRYVQYSQSFVDEHSDKAYAKIYLDYN